MEKPMTILNRLASSLGQRDEKPNITLARELVKGKDKKAIKELIQGMSRKSRAIQNDCIKVLYEIGTLEPNLIVDYQANFLDLLTSKNNRLQWGAMTALNCISKAKPKPIYEHLPTIMDAAQKGSVITRDQAVNILITLAAAPKYSNRVLNILNEQLLRSPVNQLPMYAERILPVINNENREIFISTLNLRLRDLEKESKRKRIHQVILKLKK